MAGTNSPVTGRIFKNRKLFVRTGFLACSSVLLLFLLGGLVRVTGSGMGCPDWPRCFGLVAPPTCSCQLPPDYQKIFLRKRLAKVERFARLLDKAGLHEKATALRNDKTILIPEEFNAFKAWTEYINRVFGVISGLLALAFALLALFGHFGRRVVLFSGLGLISLVINAWLGSVVVATNLLPGLVTLHFMFSFLCVFFFMYAIHLTKPIQVSYPTRPGRIIWITLFVVVMAEVLLGALARENVEFLKQTGTLVAGDGMLDYRGMEWFFTIHRLMPAFLFVLSLLAGLQQRRKGSRAAMPLLVFAAVCLLQIALGATNIVFVLPPATQVLHIVAGSILPVIAFYYILARDTAEKS